jgi:hypothetical protein
VEWAHRLAQREQLLALTERHVQQSALLGLTLARKLHLGRVLERGAQRVASGQPEAQTERAQRRPVALGAR